MEACGRIIEIASTARGRAWALGQGNGSRHAQDACPAPGEEETAAVRLFYRAWGLDSIIQESIPAS